MTAEVAWIALGFFLGGVMKGATGVGAPLVAVPLLTMFYDLQTAIVLFAIPNCVPNLWQGWRFRHHRLDNRFVTRLFVCGAIGTAIGTAMLISLPSKWLVLVLVLSVYSYVVFRLAQPRWQLSMPAAQSLVAPVSAIAATLQGATGISAPVSVTFLNAMKLERASFISSISIFFLSVSAIQLPALMLLGLLTTDKLLLGTLALVPLFAGMPVGNLLARNLSRERFDQLILLGLTAVATRLLVGLF